MACESCFVRRNHEGELQRHRLLGEVMLRTVAGLEVSPDVILEYAETFEKGLDGEAKPGVLAYSVRTIDTYAMNASDAVIAATQDQIERLEVRLNFMDSICGDRGLQEFRLPSAAGTVAIQMCAAVLSMPMLAEGGMTHVVINRDEPPHKEV